MMEPISEAIERTSDFADVVARRAAMTPEEREAEARQREERARAESASAALLSRQRYLAKMRDQLGDRFAQRRLETFDRTPATAEAYDLACEIAKHPRTRGGWFYGLVVGEGKTHLAGGIAHAAIDAAIPTIFTTGNALLRRVKDTYDSSGHLREGEGDIVRALVDIDVLILDDLGKERFNEWSGSLFYDLLNTRYEANRPLVVTSNLGPDKLADLWTKSGLDPSYGRSLVRRIAEMCSGNIVVVGAAG